MKTPNYLLACLILALVFTVSCSSNSANKCAPCPMSLQAAPNLTFRVVDKTTGQDLFFGSTAKYTASQLKVHHIINGQPDTAFLHIDTPNHYFNVGIIPANQVDTVTMNIADKPQDVLLFKTTTTGGCCSTTYLSSVTYNGTVVYTPKQGPTIVAVLAK